MYFYEKLIKWKVWRKPHKYTNTLRAEHWKNSIEKSWIRCLHLPLPLSSRHFHPISSLTMVFVSLFSRNFLTYIRICEIAKHYEHKNDNSNRRQTTFAIIFRLHHSQWKTSFFRIHSQARCMSLCVINQ